MRVQSRVAIGSTRVAIGYALEMIVCDRVEIECGDRIGSGMDLGAIEYGHMEIGLIWTTARVGLVLIE